MAKLTKIITGALGFATFAMTAAVFAKTCLPSWEEWNDAKVEDAWADLDREYGVPIGFDEAPEEEPVECHEFDRAYDEVMERPRKDPIDEGIDNILRYSVNGKTGLEPEDML